MQSERLVVFTLVSRSYCHLCHEMESALRSMSGEFRFALEVVDVDESPDLLALFDELVPVLLHEESALCHHFLDEAKVRDLLGGIG